MDEYGRMMVFVYVVTTDGAQRSKKRVTIMSRTRVTKAETIRLYDLFKIENTHIKGTCCRWIPDSHFIG